MMPDDLRKLANAILHADREAEMYRLLSLLTAEDRSGRAVGRDGCDEGVEGARTSERASRS
jgi:hypothetical protein